MDLRGVAALALAILTLLPGCTSAPSDHEAIWVLSGTLAEDADEPDLRDLEQRVARHRGALAILESFPLQFRVTDLTEAGCRALEGELRQVAYVTSVNDCAPYEALTDGDRPVSNGS